MLNIILNENELNFNDLEKEFFRAGCEAARLAFKNFLERLDEILKKQRNKGIYRHKGKKETTIKTLMGEVNFNRVIYKVENQEDIETKYIFIG